MEKLSDEKLFNEFPPITTNEWEEKITKDLKGADCQKKLIWSTQEGFDVKPYYRSEDLNQLGYLHAAPGEFPFVRGNKTNLNTWEIRQDILVKEVKSANEYLLKILNGGITSPGLKIDKSVVGTKEELAALLKDVQIECIALNLLAEKDCVEFFDYLVQIAKDRQLKFNELQGSFDFDLLSHLTTTGNFYDSEEKDFKKLEKFLLYASEKLPGYKVIGINGLNFRNAGASIVQELAFSLSAGNEYLTRLTDAGFNVDDIAKRMHFTFGIGSNYFMEIAKLRAARYLWSKIIVAYNPEDKQSAKMFVHSATTDWNKTIYDPHVNILRSTTESMSATLGGTDSMEVLPFDSVYQESSEFTSRIARNIQIILKEEAYFDKVVDPAAGSYYIENLTNSIAEHAWKLFIEIEDQGGFVSAFKKGIIQNIISKTATEKLLNIAVRKEILLGTNQYPNFNEKMGTKIDQNFPYIQEKQSGTVVAQPLDLLRGSQEIEKLRLQSESAAKRPIAFMLTIGNLAMYKARSAFACNFFACGGFEVINTNGFETIDEGIRAALNTNADIVVLCSSDDEYANLAVEAYEKINGKPILVVAGEPDCKPDLESKGIKYFISLRSNMIDTLGQFQKLLGII